jgi:hypothetical protein
MPGRRTRNLMRFRTLPAADRDNKASTAAATPSYGRQAVAAIADRIALSDCAGAVGDLNTKLKKGFPEVVLLAGSMYDNGICVKRDWERAVPYYIQAWQGGLPDGADRLAAGYAAPENGADVAAALWWASRQRDRNGQVHGVSGCAVSAAAADDMDRFVAELQAWPQARLQSCNYMTGVMATLAAELRYPVVAAMYHVGGDVTVRFLPAVPRIDLEEGEIRTVQMFGWISGDTMREREARSKGGFKQAFGNLVDRALWRYPHPDGIPAATRAEFVYHFDVDPERSDGPAEPPKMRYRGGCEKAGSMQCRQ